MLLPTDQSARIQEVQVLRYLLYARKSTDEEDRQVLSIEAQVTELREFAQKERLAVAAEFVESRTAKEPGRPVFNEMTERIRHGLADGILAWHPDRLARNSVDGGLIVYLLDTGKLQTLKFPTFWFENTPQGKFMLNIAFGQSKYYVDNLRENVLRGIRQKLRRGEYPQRPPIGYLNEPKLRTIVPDPDKAPLVQKLFEAFATGNYSVPALHELAVSWGLRTIYGNTPRYNYLWRILSDPFYIGMFRLKGELYEGSHPPLVSQEVFNKIQTLLKDRAKPRHKPKNNFPFIRLLRCATCGCLVTAQCQKGHHYYNCTKKRGKCPELPVREERLADELREILLGIAPPDNVSLEETLAFVENETRKGEETIRAEKQRLTDAIQNLDQRLDALLEARLDGEISRDEYLPRKEKLLQEKLALKDELGKLDATGGVTLKPAGAFFEAAFDAGSVARGENFKKIGDFFRQARANLTLSTRKPLCVWPEPWSILSDLRRFKPWWAEEDLNL